MLKPPRMDSDEVIWGDDVTLAAIYSWENDKRKQLEERHVFFLNSEIEQYIVGNIIRGILRLLVLAPEDKKIVLFINSNGGSLWDGWALFDALELAKSQGFEVTTVAIGQVASAATIPFLAGNPKLATPNATFVIHEPSSWLSGKTSEQKDYLNFISRRSEAYVKLVTSRSKITKRQLLKKMLRKDWFFDAEEAVKLGFADKLIFELR